MNSSPRNVFVIAYYFPPMGLSGVQRTLKFVKYLPQFGWQPTVLTVTPTGYYAQDESLLEEIKPLDIDIVRVGSLDPNRFLRKKGVVKMPRERFRKLLSFASDTFFIPDNKIGWKRPAFKVAEELFEKKKFDAIFATAPPFTDFLIGMELSESFGVPLVVDYRDPWIEYPYKVYPTMLHKWKNVDLESAVLHKAARIITTNRRVKELILLRHRFLTYNDVRILPHGFDPADFANNGASPIVKGNGRMRITHAGVFYGDRTPKHFFRAMKTVFDKQPQLKNFIEAYFVGTFRDEHIPLIRSMGLEGNVMTTGYLDHAQCVQHLVASDVLWFMVGNDRQSPGKLYEYFGARKPIIACAPSGFVQQTLREADASIVVGPKDVKGIAEAILKYYDLFTQNKLPKPKESVVQRYDRIELTKELSIMLGFLAE